MKFYHVADVHLGAKPDSGFPWAEERKDEIWQSFRKLLEQAREEKIDLILIAGDLFHRQPMLRELKELNYLFSALNDTKIVIMAGNHDYLKKDSHYLTFSWSENVICFLSNQRGRIVFPHLNTAVYSLSYHQQEIQEPLYQNWNPKTDGLCSILLAHGGDEKHIPIEKRDLLESEFDYIALGHFHQHTVIEPNRIEYAGALEPVDRNDMGQHGYISGVFEDGKMNTAFHPWACREYRNLDICIDEYETDFSLQEKIGKIIEEQGKDNIYKIRLSGMRDPDIQFFSENYKKLGNIIEFIDDTNLSYNFSYLLREHKGDVIGNFIQKLYHPNMSEIEKKALCYGLQAMMEVRK